MFYRVQFNLLIYCSQIIDAISEAFRSITGITLLDVSAGSSTNRTVYTFVGTPQAVVEGAIAGARVAYQLIDMTKHKGEHKRLGALDVCPFIPVRGVTMDDCVQCAHNFAQRLAEELDVPVFMYGFASNFDYRYVPTMLKVFYKQANQFHRREVPQIRAGEYEQLSTRLQDQKWKPDYGVAKFVPKWGASIVGARKFLIAYNVNLIGTKEQAHRIALIIRATRPNGEQGRLPATQAMGWYLKEQNIAQVTANILDHQVTSLHHVYEEVLKEAAKLKIPVTGSEIVGLVPLEALLAVSQFYIERESLFVLEEDQKVHLAINRLGLNSLSNFEPSKRIIEYMIKQQEKEETNNNRLINHTVANFSRLVADRSSAPGGGSVGANVAALGAALASMVAKLSYGKKLFEHNDSLMRTLIPPLHHSVGEILNLVDDDTDAFTDYGEALKMVQDSEQAKLM